MNLTLKSVPKLLHARLKEAAKRNRRSLNTEAILALEREYLASPIDPEKFLAELRRMHEGMPPITPFTSAELRAAIEEGRE